MIKDLKTDKLSLCFFLCSKYSLNAKKVTIVEEITQDN
jgi:hypothetical protein